MFLVTSYCSQPAPGDYLTTLEIGFLQCVIVEVGQLPRTKDHLCYIIKVQAFLALPVAWL